MLWLGHGNPVFIKGEYRRKLPEIGLSLSDSERISLLQLTVGVCVCKTEQSHIQRNISCFEYADSRFKII